ncbi:NAD-dependent protein deacylase [Bengtsoniella intestinalis]|uniref:NAD-dependent protein deacylase n=1 Tax=Bengtsoniella intestinalis TaxID=3073143 RepID=UPI00391F1D81
MIERLQQMIDTSEKVVFFGGAGVSTESGIPDFRSVDGLYNQHYAYPPETILSHTFYEKNTAEFYRFYREKMLYLDAQPNACHRYLAQLEQAGKLTAVVTQNIDGLHQKAGSKQVYELHGSVHRNHCLRCGKAYTVTHMQGDGLPTCSCGGAVKPDVVLYEEGLDEATIEGAVNAIAQCDMLIIGGTSLAVYPAASFVQYYRGKKLVVINKSKLQVNADLVIDDAIGAVFAQLH